MTLIWDLVWSPPDLYPTRHIFASHLKRFTLAKFGLETTPKPDPTHISRPFTVNFLKLENTCHKPPVKVIWPSTSNILPISTAKNMYVKHTCIKLVWSPFWNLQTFNICPYIFCLKKTSKLTSAKRRILVELKLATSPGAGNATKSSGACSASGVSSARGTTTTPTSIGKRPKPRIIPLCSGATLVQVVLFEWGFWGIYKNTL